MKITHIHRRPLIVTGVLLFTLIFLAILLPIPSQILMGGTEHPVRILDRHGALLYEYRNGAPGTKEWLPIAEIPSSAIRAVIDTEDRTFYSHHGVSLQGTIRAFYQNIISGHIVSGGSTITQQLVRVRGRARGRSVWRKLLESYYALKLEQQMSKEEILDAYLNSAYFGHAAYGIQAASTTYFGKSVHELSLSEISLLIGLLQSPSGYDPFQNLPLARQRQKTVLDAMVTQGDITQEQKDEAVAAEIHLTTDRVSIEAPHFVFWILSRQDLPEDATEIRTTLDLDLQHQAERAVENHLKTLQDKNVTSAAVVVLDAINGDVLAMVGSADYFDEKHDGAVNVALASRQPGSAIKPFTYALAFAKGETAASTVGDVETQFLTQEGNPYIPRNYDYDEHGLVRYRDALANSYNIASVKVLEKVGVGPLLQFLRSAGISTLTQPPEHYGLALTLGDAEVTLLELTRDFGMFARGGRTLHERNLLTDAVMPGTPIISSSIAWLISDILSDDQARLPQFGSDSALNFDFPVAVKTGTTRNSRDNWTVGYTPTRVVGVWVGNADNSPMKGTSGVTGAGPIFHDVMESAMSAVIPSSSLRSNERIEGRQSDDEWPDRPSNIIDLSVCAHSGKLPTPACPQIIQEHFIAGTEPKEKDSMFQKIAIDSRNGLRAGESCPKQYVIDQTFAVFPPEVQRWARENGWKEPPTGFSSLCGAVIPPAHRSLSEGGSSSTRSGERIEEWLTITRPAGGDEFLLDPMVPDKNEKIVFEASASPDIKEVEWWVDKKRIGTGTSPEYRIEWSPVIGKWTVEARAGKKNQIIHIAVQKQNH